MLEGLPDRALGKLRVAAQHPNAVWEPIQGLAGDGQPHTDRQALPERAGGHVGGRNARGRVTLEPAAELAEAEQLLVVDRPYRFEDRVVERRRVALGEDQVVAMGIVGAGIVELQMPVEQHGHELGRRHGGGGMARAGGGAGPDRIDPQLLRELVTKALVGSGLARAAADVFGNSHEWFLSLLTLDSHHRARAPETEATRHTASAKPFRATTFLVRRPRRAGRREVPGPVRPRSPARPVPADGPGRLQRRASRRRARPRACRSCKTRRRDCRRR